MYMYFQPKISVAQEEADITEMIDKEYERNPQEERDYYEKYSKQKGDIIYDKLKTILNTNNTII